MQAKEHLQTLGRAWWFIVLFGVVVAGITYAVASKRPDSYKAIQTYQIQLVNRQPTSDYQYGSYYDLKGAELFTQHVMSLLRSPAVIEQIYQGAGLSYTIDNVSRFTSQFRTDVDSVQQFTVTFSRYNADEAEALANSMSTVLTEQVAQAQVDVTGSSMFQLSAFEPVVVFQKTNLVLVTVTALIAGWILAMILVYLRRYLQ